MSKKKFCELIGLHPKSIYKGKKGKVISSAKREREKMDKEVLLGIKEVIRQRCTYGYKRVTALYNRKRVHNGLSRYNKKRIYRVMRDNGLLLPKSGIFKTGEVEMDESYFGARRVRGLRGRGARGKTIVFGLRKRKGKVYTQVIKNCSKKEIIPLIRKKISKSAIVYTDGFKTYDGLVDMGYKRHYRVHHGKNEFSKKQGKIKNHINGIENFWGLAKVRFI